MDRNREAAAENHERQDVDRDREADAGNRERQDVDRRMLEIGARCRGLAEREEGPSAAQGPDSAEESGRDFGEHALASACR